MRIALLACVLTSTPAAADVLDTPVSVAINCPCWWSNGESVAGTLGIGLSDHDAVRINLATYRNHSGIGTTIGEAFFGGEGDDTDNSGRIWDVGVAWTNYRRQLWSGFTYELGVLRRARNIRDDDYNTFSGLATDTATYAGRAQIGWSWLLGGHVFIAASVGLSVGWERGRETVIADLDQQMMTTTSDVSRTVVSGEGYLRFGIAR